MASRWHECWRCYGKEVSHLGMAAYSSEGVAHVEILRWSWLRGKLFECICTVRSKPNPTQTKLSSGDGVRTVFRRFGLCVCLISVGQKDACQEPKLHHHGPSTSTPRALDIYATISRILHAITRHRYRTYLPTMYPPYLPRCSSNDTSSPRRAIFQTPETSSPLDLDC